MMSGKIRFEKHFQKSTFRNPLMGNQLDTQELEIRRDPLTGARSIFNPRLEDKVAVFFGPSDQALIDRLAQESAPKCFLCGDRWKQMTPTYPDSVIPGGRVQKGEAVLFPNLFPVYQVHAVIRVGSAHYLPLDQFPVSTVEEALWVFLEFARSLFRADPTVRFLTLNGNYLGPAGASIPHPHFQAVGGDLPFNFLELLLDRGRAYQARHSTCYWVDLVEEEKRLAKRYIGSSGPVEWISSYSPQGTNEIVGILPEKTSVLEFDEKDLAGLAQGFCAVLRGYHGLGVSTFNFALFSGPLDVQDKAFRCQLRIISRQNVYENYRTDDYFLQKLLRNELILNTPEFLASSIGKAFKGS